MPTHNSFRVGQRSADKHKLFTVRVPDLKRPTRNSGEEPDPPPARPGELDEDSAGDYVAGVGPARLISGPVEECHVDVPDQRGEHKPCVCDHDAAHGSRVGAESVGLVGPERADVDAGLEVEEADGAVGEAAGEVDVGEGETAADDGSGVAAVVHVGRVEVQGGVGVSASDEIPGQSMTVNELVVPRGTRPIGEEPDASGQPLPQKIRPGHSMPRRTNLRALRCNHVNIN